MRFIRLHLDRVVSTSSYLFWVYVAIFSNLVLFVVYVLLNLVIIHKGGAPEILEAKSYKTHLAVGAASPALSLPQPQCGPIHRHLFCPPRLILYRPIRSVLHPDSVHIHAASLSSGLAFSLVHQTQQAMRALLLPPCRSYVR